MKAIIEKSKDLLEKLISKIKSVGEQLDADIHNAAVSCLYHAEQHGDVTLATRLVAAMPRSSRRKALIYWFETFGPLVFDTEKEAFHVSRAKEKAPYQVEQASETPFYDYVAEKNPAPFSIDKLVSYVQNQIKKAATKGEIDQADLEVLKSKLGTVSLPA